MLYTIRKHDEWGTKFFFHRIKYCWRKRDERVAVHCSLFTVNFRMPDDFFFNEKILCVCQRDCYPDTNPVYSVRRKTCLQNMANTFYTLFAVRRRFFVISPLFRCCWQIVYSWLKGFSWTIRCCHSWPCSNRTIFWPTVYLIKLFINFTQRVIKIFLIISLELIKTFFIIS